MAALAMAVVAVAVVAVGIPVVARDPAAPATASVGAAVVPPPPLPCSVRVLAAWDRRRAAAWADADVGALRRLYVAGSRTGHRDVAMLSAYAARGLRVRGLAVQLFAWEVSDRSPTVLRLVVTDRVVGGVVVGGRTELRLPVDRASRRSVTLVRQRGRWLVSEVSPAPSR